MISDALFRKFYRDETTYNGTLIFYDWVRSHATGDTRLLNLGAGPPTENPIRILKGEVAEVVGADIDPIVLENPELDRAVVIEKGKLPLEDEAFDLVISDYVMEHVEFPLEFLGELRRVLRPGGVFLFRTPNRFHYVAIASALTPHWLHTAIANRMRGLPEETHEPWPTFYRANSRGAVARLGREAGFRSSEIRMIESEPSCLVFHAVPFLAGVAYERLVNATPLLAGLRSNMLGKLVK